MSFIFQALGSDDLAFLDGGVSFPWCVSENTVARGRGGIYLWDPTPPGVWFGFPGLWETCKRLFCSTRLSESCQTTCQLFTMRLKYGTILEAKQFVPFAGLQRDLPRKGKSTNEKSFHHDSFLNRSGRYGRLRRQRLCAVQRATRSRSLKKLHCCQADFFVAGRARFGPTGQLASVARTQR